MRKTDKHRRNRHGASTVFLAIILSALILIECTFLAFVWNLDYALSVNTALKTQIDTILSDYNRQLFDVYGVYAFTIDGVDDYCFNKALEINGMTAQSTLVAGNCREFTAGDLRCAIASYYWYRGTGISLNDVVDGYSEFLCEIDENGIVSKISEYMQSPASSYVSKILSGNETAEEWINKAGDILNIEDLVEETDGINSIRSDINDMLHDSDLGIDIDIEDWESLLGTVSFMEHAVGILQDESLATTTKFNTSHYCAYNFDCWLPPDGDCSITGTEFKYIHGEKKADCEYIITGLDRVPAVLEVETIMCHIFVLGNILKDYADEKIRNTLYAIAVVISEIITAISEGTVKIDPKIIAFGLTVYVAMVQGLKDLWDILQGDRAVFFDYDGVDMITLSYRDILYLMAVCTPEEELLQRSVEILTRDYGNLYTGIELEAEFRGTTYTLEKSYQLYQ